MWFWHNTSAGHLRPRRCRRSVQPDEAHTHGVSFCVLHRECMCPPGQWWPVHALQRGSYPLHVASPVSVCASGRNHLPFRSCGPDVCNSMSLKHSVVTPKASLCRPNTVSVGKLSLPETRAFCPALHLNLSRRPPPQPPTSSHHRHHGIPRRPRYPCSLAPTIPAATRAQPPSPPWNAPKTPSARPSGAGSTG